MKRSYYRILLLILSITLLYACKNSAPEIEIKQPLNNATFVEGQEVKFEATITDEEDGLKLDD